jgi:hypothetical protein
MSERRKDIIAICILILVIIIRFYPFVFKATPINTDSWKRIYPWRANYTQEEIISTDFDYNSEYDIWYPFAKDQIKQGIFPNWNPYSFCGTPLYANHLVPLFHVPFALALLWDGSLIGTAYAFFMAIFGTLFFYLFLRNWKLSVFISLFGGLAFFLSGWQVYIIPPEVATFIWIPAILLFHDRFLESNRLSDACIGAFCVGQLLIAGYPIYIAHFFYFVLVYILWRRFHPHFKWKTPVSRWIIAILVMSILGVGFSAVQNYPTYQYMKISNRTITTEKENLKQVGEIIERKQDVLESAGKSSKIDLLKYFIAKRAMIINPEYNTDLNNSRNYAGPVVSLLSLIGLFLAHRRFRAIKICYLVFGAFVILSPIYTIFARIIPGWSISTLLPREVFYFLMFFFAALGLEFVMKFSSRNRIILILTLIIIGFSAVVWASLPQVQTFQSDFKAFRWNQDVDRIVRTMCIILSWAACSFIFHWGFIRFSKKYIRTAFLIIFIVSGLMTQSYLFPYFSNSDPMPANDEMVTITNLVKDGRITRYSTKNPHVSGYERQDFLFLPNIPTKFGIYDTQGYDSLMLNDYVRFYETAAPGNIINGRGMFCVKDLSSIKRDSILSIATGTKYVFLENEPDLNTRVQPLYDGKFSIYEISSTDYPFARFVNDYILEDEFDGIPDSVNFNQTVILDRKPSIEENIPEDYESYENPNSDTIRIDRKSTSLKLDFNAEQDAILYIAEAYHPSWRAELDGKEVEILKANLAFRAIEVPQGEHSIFMWFDGRDVVIGSYMSIIALILSVSIGFLDKRRKNPRGENV